MGKPFGAHINPASSSNPSVTVAVTPLPYTSAFSQGRP